MCGKREGCHADCKNNPAHRLLRERLSMCEARVKSRAVRSLTLEGGAQPARFGNPAGWECSESGISRGASVSRSRPSSRFRTPQLRESGSYLNRSAKVQRMGLASRKRVQLDDWEGDGSLLPCRCNSSTFFSEVALNKIHGLNVGDMLCSKFRSHRDWPRLRRARLLHGKNCGDQLL
jgi:hypothetical protein